LKTTTSVAQDFESVDKKLLTDSRNVRPVKTLLQGQLTLIRELAIQWQNKVLGSFNRVADLPSHHHHRSSSSGKLLVPSLHLSILSAGDGIPVIASIVGNSIHE
jgi:hypothetical protein